MPGRYFDEWKVGDSVAHAITRTVTETDNLLISTLTHNPQPLHIDYEAAAKTEFGKPLVNSVFTFSLMIGVSVDDTTLGTLVANLGYDKLVFPEAGVRRRYAALAKASASRFARASRGPMPGSSPGRTAASTSAASWCASARAPRYSEEAGNEPSRAAGCSSPPTARGRSPRRSTARPTRSSSTSRTASRPRRRWPPATSSRSFRQRSGGPQWWVRDQSDRQRACIKDDLDLIAKRRHPRHRPAQGRERRRHRPARTPHRQHPDPRHRHRNRGEPVRTAVLPRPQVAARGDELGRGGPVGGARRVVQI